MLKRNRAKRITTLNERLAIHAQKVRERFSNAAGGRTGEMI